MRKSLFFLFTYLPLLLLSQSQSEAYKSKWFSLYYSYRSLGLQSMRFEISSPEFIDFAKEKTTLTDYYLLNGIIQENLIYTVSIDYKHIPEESKNEIIPRLEALRRQFIGVAAEFNTFLVNSPFLDIPPQANILKSGDTLTFTYELFDAQGNKVTVHKSFLEKSGLMLSQTSESGVLKIITKPFFQDIFSKWFCVGWETQIYENGSLRTGTAVRYDLSEGERGIWLPTNLKLKVQSASNPGISSFLELYLKDYQIRWLPMANDKKK